MGAMAWHGPHLTIRQVSYLEYIRPLWDTNAPSCVEVDDLQQRPGAFAATLVMTSDIGLAKVQRLTVNLEPLADKSLSSWATEVTSNMVRGGERERVDDGGAAVG